ncbi:hypothetical protein JCM1393_21720 [Clostridium carnis]
MNVAIVVALPINILIFYCIYININEYMDYNKRKEKRLENLLNNTIYIDVSEEEKYMIDSLTKLNKFKSNNQYIRNTLKSIKNI